MKSWRFGLLISAFVQVSLTLTAQNNEVELDYEVVAKGFNAPLNDVFVVCYNKFYNLEMLSTSFRMKNNLEDKPVKKKMLVEIFLGDRTKGAVDIKLNRVAQNTQEIIVDYEIIYDESDAGSEHRNPYLIIQTVRSKKQFVLIENGQRRTAGQKLYFDN